MENKISITDAALQEAAEQDMDAFLAVFTNAYTEAINGSLGDGNMDVLNGHQHSLLAYRIFCEEVMQGGFIQLIQNGYGGYIFNNPFAKSMREFGADKLAKLVYKAKEIYDPNKVELERETTEEEFHAMYETFEAFDALEESFFEIEEETTDAIASYVDEHLELFATVIE